VIIGGGPGGYEAALVAAQLGAQVTVVEADGLGGACVLTDCVPSKTLIATSTTMSVVHGAADLGIRVGTVPGGGALGGGAPGGAASGRGQAQVDAPRVYARVKALAQAQSADVAKRLARVARHVIFGDPASPSGPAAVSATREAQGIAIEFAGVESGLVSYSHASPIGFELCGDSAGSCRFAEAQVEGSRVRLSVPGAAAPPARVRYCWGDSPVCTLFDRSGLPAVPFELSVVSPPVHRAANR